MNCSIVFWMHIILNLSQFLCTVSPSLCHYSAHLKDSFFLFCFYRTAAWSWKICSGCTVYFKIFTHLNLSEFAFHLVPLFIVIWSVCVYFYTFVKTYFKSLNKKCNVITGWFFECNLLLEWNYVWSLFTVIYSD